MSSPELALQAAVRARLAGSSEITALVPVASILDRNERPNPRPSIVIGEGQAVDEGDSIDRLLVRVYLDLHVWVREPSTEISKAIAGAIRRALRPRLVLASPYHCADSYVRTARFFRDPDGESSHAVVTVDARVREGAQP